MHVVILLQLISLKGISTEKLSQQKCLFIFITAVTHAELHLTVTVSGSRAEFLSEG